MIFTESSEKYEINGYNNRKQEFNILNIKI